MRVKLEFELERNEPFLDEQEAKATLRNRLEDAELGVKQFLPSAYRLVSSKVTADFPVVKQIEVTR